MKEKLQLLKDNDKEKIVKYLSEGKIGLIPTDTLYGICSRMDRESSVKRIYDLKSRDRDKPLIILADSFETALNYIEYIPEGVRALLDNYWPGALTVTFKANMENVPSYVRAKGLTVAIRVSDNYELRNIIKKLGVPIVAPSANFQGKNPPDSLSKVDEKIVDIVDFIVEGECKMKIASTIIDCSTGKCSMVRQGAVKIQDLEL